MEDAGEDQGGGRAVGGAGAALPERSEGSETGGACRSSSGVAPVRWRMRRSAFAGAAGGRAGCWLAGRRSGMRVDVAESLVVVVVCLERSILVLPLNGMRRNDVPPGRTAGTPLILKTPGIFFVYRCVISGDGRVVSGDGCAFSGAARIGLVASTGDCGYF